MHPDELGIDQALVREVCARLPRHVIRALAGDLRARRWLVSEVCMAASFFYGHRQKEIARLRVGRYFADLSAIEQLGLLAVEP